MNRHRTRPALIIAIVLALLAATLAAVGVRSALGPDSASRAASSAGSTAADGNNAARNDATGNGAGDGQSGIEPGEHAAGSDADDVQVLDVDLLEESSSAGGGGGQDVPLDDAGTQDPDPCDSLPAGRSLLVAPDPLVLPATVMTGSLHITNCGSQSVNWTALTIPKVTLHTAGGNLAGGAATELGFTIDESAVDGGALTFKIKVSEPGANTYVDVHAFKSLVNPAIPQLPGGPQFQGAPGSGGCAVQCITKAWLTPNALNPNVSLEVKTTVPARHKVWVSTQAPVMNGEVPTFPGVNPIAANNSPVTTWTAPLAPLAASTSYHIVVEATDANDNRSYQAGQFTTITPVAGPSGFAPTGHHGGCAAQCITKAWVNQPAPGADPSIEVTTNVPATVKVYVSEQAPATAPDGTPQPAGNPAASSGAAPTTNWTTTLTGLKSDTTYHVVVDAKDTNGGRSLRAGQVHTLHHTVDVLVTFRQIHVIRDGDSGKHNRGELAFRLGVGGTKVAETPERKIHSGTTVVLNSPGRAAGISHLVTGVDGTIPLIAVQALERDRDGKIEYCTMGSGILPGVTGRFPSCDITYNTAFTDLHHIDDFGRLPSCAPFVLAGVNPLDKCLLLQSEDHGASVPHFSALVTLRIVDW